ncbi:MAG: FMN-binding protein [Candidatus Omnitrophica bacterium]|nr:FMN-binding protein [Candidatus Omnitrophota bacterium]
MRAFPFHLVSVPGIVLVVTTPGFATVYLTVEQAQQMIFPGQSLTAISLTLSEEEKSIIQKRYGAPVNDSMKIWRTEDGRYFIVDQVIGKHELITYAVGIHPDGSIAQIEIMDYREAYGDEIRQKRWRRQFGGKTMDSPLELNEDIKNISGATLSCRHLTEGVKRLLGLYELVLKK